VIVRRLFTETAVPSTSRRELNTRPSQFGRYALIVQEARQGLEILESVSIHIQICRDLSKKVEKIHPLLSLRFTAGAQVGRRWL